MTALADLMRALIPFARLAADEPRSTPVVAARDALRKHAPCDGCGGQGERALEYNWYPCDACSGAGWTPASVEAAIKREGERERLTGHILTAARDVVFTRDALDGRRKAEPNPDNREPGVPLEVDAGIDFLGDCLAPLKTGGCNG